MADLEGLARTLISQNFDEQQIIATLMKEYLFYKAISIEDAEQLARAVLLEVQNSDKPIADRLIRDLLDYPKADITIGRQGVGCRGWGDFFVHKLIADLSETATKPELSPKSLDDAGAVVFKGQKKRIYLVSKMEGMHSRLSDYPFLAGFHVTRAALRDLYVKGAKPISIMIDIHLGDDCDVGKLFDFMGGVAAVSELTETPITAGSTLRIGGDMVIGTRITGGIAAIGVAENLLKRRNIKSGDVILMTEGAGGGTIATTAIYGGLHEIVRETLNIKFLEACETLIAQNLLPEIHCMCDVTNGGLRGDLHEVAYEAKVGITVFEQKIRPLVNHKVLKLLEDQEVDYLGVSLDALLIFCSKEAAGKICTAIQEQNIKIDQIGEVNENQNEIRMITERGEAKLIPKFRESAYTPVKQLIGEEIDDRERETMAKKIEDTAQRALEKRANFVKWIKNQS
ncbi:MAG: AIR synthase-related protein [Candidatus Helarchaeota archaeon]